MADFPSPTADKDVATSSDKSEAESRILELARKRFRLAADAEAEIRREALEDHQFAAGDQWPLEIKQAREIDARPCLTLNDIPTYVRQITNDQRQNRPSIKVSPVDDKGTIETAKVFQGLIRHIEAASNADVAYDTAFDSTVRGGFGYFRILPQYVGDDSFEQELVFRRIRNSFMVYKDPASKEPDGSDAEYYFIIDDLEEEEFEEQYGEDAKASLEDFSSVGDSGADWLPGGKIRVAEYFYKEYEEKTLHLTSLGNVVEDDQKEHLPEGAKIVKTRKVKVPTIKWCKICATKILEESIWPGQWIPIFPVIGEELDINGRLSLAGIVRYAKDAARMRNYWKSAETEAIALAPKAPWVGVEGQFKGHELRWKKANTSNQAYLEYKPVSLNGQPAPPPQRQSIEPAVGAITNAALQASQDIKNIIGIYDPSMGKQIAEQSGAAIKRLNQQAQTTNFHLVDNLHRSIRHAGRVLVDAIPHYYDTRRAVRIIGEDGETDIQVINAVLEEDDKDGLPVSHQLDIGRYDVVIDTGPSYQTKREEAVNTLLDMARNMPQVNQAAPDLIAGAMDIPHAQEIAQRLKKLLPPQLQEDQSKQPIPPAIAAQMKQMGDTIQHLSNAYHAAQNTIDQKTMELESRERIEMAKIQKDLEIAYATLNAKAGQVVLENQISAIQHREDLMHSANSIDVQAQYDAQKQAQDQLHQQQLAQQQAAAQKALSNAAPQGGGAPNPTGGDSPGSPMGN